VFFFFLGRRGKRFRRRRDDLRSRREKSEPLKTRTRTSADRVFSPFRLFFRRHLSTRLATLRSLSTRNAKKKKKQMVEESELKWDCGDAYPEPALDEVPAKIVGRNEAGLMLGGALVVMAGVYNFAKWVDKPATQPFADKTFPFDGLKAELGRE
jgi:hypothetical protein